MAKKQEIQSVAKQLKRIYHKEFADNLYKLWKSGFVASIELRLTKTKGKRKK